VTCAIIFDIGVSHSPVSQSQRLKNAKEGWTKGTTYKESEAAVGEGGWVVQGGKVQRLRGDWDFPLT
jgi:hypothetical protein